MREYNRRSCECLSSPMVAQNGSARTAARGSDLGSKSNATAAAIAACRPRQPRAEPPDEFGETQVLQLIKDELQTIDARLE
jgi:hypothetical protein